VDVIGAHGEVLLSSKLAQVIHPVLDIAVLPAVQGKTKLALSAASPAAGDQIVALGSAPGVAYLAGTGTLSGAAVTDGRNLLQVSAALSSGYAGGPVLNRAGEVIGLIVSDPVRGQLSSSSVPSRIIQAVLRNPPAKIDLASFTMPSPPVAEAPVDSVSAASTPPVDTAPVEETETSLREAMTRSPGDAKLRVRLADLLMANKRPDAAIIVYREGISINPLLNGAYAGIAQAFSALDKPDSVTAAIKVAAAQGEDRAQLASIAFRTAGNSYRQGTESKNRPALAKAMSLLLLSDELQTSSDAKFLAGMAAFLIGQSEVTEAQTTHQCPTIQDAMKSFAQAIQYLPAGSGVYPEAKQTLTASAQFAAAASDMAGRYCK
jgi:hypothetical protein